MDRLTAMRSFIEVANTASFTKAADNLSLSRLQVSRHVQEVEDWLKQRLLHRTTRKVSLTTAGEEALIRCEQILHQTAELETRALEQSQLLNGTIRIAAPIGLAQNMLLAVVEDFTQRHPNVLIDIVASDRLSQLVDERVDIALRFTQQPDDTLIARRLMSVGTVICASPSYLNQHPPINTPNDLTQHNCFVHMSNNKWDLVKDNEQLSVTVNGNIRANDMEILCRAALHHKGLVRLPCDLANVFIASGTLVRVLPEFHSPSSALWAVYLSRSYQTPLVRQFIDFIAQSWKNDLIA
ncbi:LysR family transcriptional regulator [Vibrio anguillarum]|uniref:LysR family transcriptional regulator n=1 Tax=Vibrio anguillarum TaxID=55601 RepID=UPI00188A44F2|nr:LysR family transcriptional regulator [Vibrio anguillarum]MBF4257644.1 LysR family transcriptional regulator [Vibrio anguillarum]MBF4277864.1 LysR family transcriptional regulator [Vibrio anguillarum]MBF4299886.1 LysR family transcriptional regulator [Vibrio anguillarum]MBF4363344.1 LysR family transcriptional regulator [Vibrio anguillarum]MBF4398386.1 LysR family transcriptional regulator [Vibrio anguillarum]